MYSYGISGPGAVDIVDSMDIFKSERIYESIFLSESYDCTFSRYSSSLVSSHFCYDCRSSQNCFMCVGLEGKQYCFKNEQYTKDEYLKILESYRLDTFSGQQKAKQEFASFMTSMPARESYMIGCENCTGDGLLNCKNAQHCFTGRRLHNVKYFENGNDITDGMDMLVGGENELCYEGITPDNNRLALFTIFSYKNSDITYTEHCFGSHDLFGCAGIRQGEYCILNKQYSKEEYFALREKIIEHMKATGEWGEFFPGQLSHFGYNETITNDNYPLSKEEALKKGFTWFDNVQFTTGKETVELASLPESISETSNDITKEIFACSTTGRNYRITEQELNFYKKMKLPIPRQCFFARHQERLKLRHPRKFY